MVAALTVRIMKLADSTATSSKAVCTREFLVHRCERLESRLKETATALTSMTREDLCKINYSSTKSNPWISKKEMIEISNAFLSLTLKDSDALPSKVTSLEKKLFDCFLSLKELSRSDTTPSSSHSHQEPKEVKLPKLDVPRFSGNILHWTRAILYLSPRTSQPNAEKFVYLQQAL